MQYRKHQNDSARHAIVPFALALALLVAVNVHAESAPKPDAGDVSDPLPRLIATLDSEPLALFAVRDARSLSEKFAATALAQMIADPQYDAGERSIESRIAALLGASPRELWPALEKNLSGPIALALLPGKSDSEEKDAPMRLVLLVEVPATEVGDALKQQWPKNTPVGSLIAAAELKTVAVGDLPSADKLPAWATHAAWPKGDILLRALPLKLCDAARPLTKQNKPVFGKLSTDSSLFEQIEGSGIDAMSWGVACKGEALVEKLVIDAAEDDSSFRKLAGAMREKITGWEGLTAATPSDVDAALMVQTELSELGADLPYLFQSIERFLRGKRWSSLTGKTADALEPTRYRFLTDRMQGSFSLIARAAITGELRLTLASAIKGSDVEAYRGEFVKGLEKTGGVFETLVGARKIGGALPLGAAFHGRGQFASPVIGLSPGWAWLCSSSVAYQELTDAFKGGRTFGAREKKRVTENGAAPDAPVPAADDWTPEDAVRGEINLDRVLKIGYAAWLLSSNEGPSIGNYKIPSELLPSPGVFARNLGKLRASASRTGNRIEIRSSCVFPGVTLAALSALQDASEAIGTGRKMAAEAAAAPKPLPDKRNIDAPAEKDKRKKEKQLKPDADKQPDAAPAPAKESK